MLSLFVPVCVVPAWVVPNLLLRGAWNLVLAHARPRLLLFVICAFHVATQVSSLFAPALLCCHHGGVCEVRRR